MEERCSDIISVAVSEFPLFLVGTPAYAQKKYGNIMFDVVLTSREEWKIFEPRHEKQRWSAIRTTGVAMHYWGLTFPSTGFQVDFERIGVRGLRPWSMGPLQRLDLDDDGTFSKMNTQ